MKVYLWVHDSGVYLLNEDFTEWSKPYFITHPQRTLLLKERYTNLLMNKVDLLCTVTDEELEQLVAAAVIKWKPMLSYMKTCDGKLLGFAPEYIATCEY